MAKDPAETKEKTPKALRHDPAKRKGKKTECQKMDSMMEKADYLNKQEDYKKKDKKDQKDQKDRKGRKEKEAAE